MENKLRKKFILFDMDGTLIDSAPVVIRRYVETFSYFGKEIPSDKELHALVGPSAAMTMEKYLGIDLVQEGIAYYRSIASKEGYEDFKSFQGIPEVLNQLYESGFKMAVATSKPEIEATNILNFLELGYLFEEVSGASDAENIHTKTDVMKRALEKMKVLDLNESIMVGDRIFDIEGSIECGIDSVFVAWGGADLDEGQNALHIVQSPNDLLELFVLK